MCLRVEEELSPSLSETQKQHRVLKETKTWYGSQNILFGSTEHCEHVCIAGKPMFSPNYKILHYIFIVEFCDSEIVVCVYTT